jgi:hypothetical protein
MPEALKWVSAIVVVPVGTVVIYLAVLVQLYILAWIIQLLSAI